MQKEQRPHRHTLLKSTHSSTGLLSSESVNRFRLIDNNDHFGISIRTMYLSPRPYAFMHTFEALIYENRDISFRSSLTIRRQQLFRNMLCIWHSRSPFLVPYIAHLIILICTMYGPDASALVCTSYPSTGFSLLRHVA